MPQIQSIVYKPKNARRSPDAYVRVPLDKANLVVGKGIEGDQKGVPNRQLNIMSAEMLASLAGEGYKTAPGELGEQIIVNGLQVETLEKGAILEIGDGGAQVEIVKLREGCDRFAGIQNKTDFSGRLGVLARVLTPGEIAVGSEIRVLEPVREAEPTR